MTNDLSDYINLLARITHIICNHPFVYLKENPKLAYMERREDLGLGNLNIFCP